MLVKADVLDRHCGFVNAQDTGSFARCRTDSASELGKIVRLVQSVQCLAPPALIYQIVPLGNEAHPISVLVPERFAQVKPQLLILDDNALHIGTWCIVGRVSFGHATDLRGSIKDGDVNDVGAERTTGAIPAINHCQREANGHIGVRGNVGDVELQDIVWRRHPPEVAAKVAVRSVTLRRGNPASDPAAGTRAAGDVHRRPG